MVQSSPLVSVIVVNHNGIDFVDACLSSLFNNDYPNFEVIFVDNASTDGSLEYVKKAFDRESRLRFVENSGSFGPAVGRNRGAKAATGKYLIFFDNDTKVDRKCIYELVKAMEGNNTIGAGQAKLLRMDTDNLYDCAGDYLGPLGFLIERSRGAQDKGQFDFIADILSAKSAASIIRRGLFDELGGFDEDFYMYLEETDLSWRVWLAGYKVVFMPQAVVYHAFETPKKNIKKYYSKYIVRYYGCRNYISTLIKNLEVKNWFRFLPMHISSWLCVGILFLLKGSVVDFYYITKGVFWNFLNFNRLLVKHRYISAHIRKVKDTVIFKSIKSDEKVTDYLRKISVYLNSGL